MGSYDGWGMRITFYEEASATTAVDIFKRHGFAARRLAATVVTSCPTLWAVTMIDRSIGLDRVAELDVASRDVVRSSIAPALSGKSPEPLPASTFNGQADLLHDPRGAAD